MACTEDNTMVTDPRDGNMNSANLPGGETATAATITNQPVNNGSQLDTQQQGQTATASLPATQSNPNYTDQTATQPNPNYNNLGFNMGQMPQQWQPPQQFNHHWQQPQWQPPPAQHHQCPQPQPQHWQPTPSQPLPYPNYSGFYPNHHQFQGFGYPPMGQNHGHQQNMAQINAMPPTQSHQQPAGTVAGGGDTRNNGRLTKGRTWMEASPRCQHIKRCRRNPNSLVR